VGMESEEQRRGKTRGSKEEDRPDRGISRFTHSSFAILRALLIDGLSIKHVIYKQHGVKFA